MWFVSAIFLSRVVLWIIRSLDARGESISVISRGIGRAIVVDTGSSEVLSWLNGGNFVFWWPSIF